MKKRKPLSPRQAFATPFNKKFIYIDFRTAEILVFARMKKGRK